MYPPHYYGGYELVCRHVMDRWRERGHTVEVLTTTMRVAGVPDDADVGVRRQLRFAWEDHVLLSPPRREQLANERHNHQVLAATLNAFTPDVVSVWNMGAMSLGLLEALRRRDIPVVLNLCDDWLVYGPNLDPWTRQYLGRPRAVTALAQRTSGVPCGLPNLANTTALFISEFTRKRAAEHSKMPTGRQSVTWSGIDEREFPVDTRATRERAWDWQLLGVGRIDERKGIEFAIRALAQLPREATLTWNGQGDAGELARLQAIADEIGVSDRVRWDSRPRAELRTLYRSADAFLFPSTWAEPFGLVPIEAMASGTPVIGTGTGGSAEFLLDGRTALVTPPGDAGALAAAVARLAGDAALRKKLVKGGAAVAKSLTIGNLAGTLEAWHLAAAAGFADGEPSPRVLDIT